MNNKIIFLLCFFLCSWGLADNLHNENLNSVDFTIEESSAIKENLSLELQKYIRDGVYPQIQPRYVDLKHTVAATEFITTKDDVVADYFDYYFGNEPNYLCSLGKEDAQEVKYLEALLLSNKKILLFVKIMDTLNYETAKHIVRVQNNDNVVGSQGILLVGFDHEARYFIAKTNKRNIGDNGYILLDYAYIKKWAQSAFYVHSSLDNEVVEARNVNFEITKWDVGGGNIFRPKAKVYGTVNGHPAFIKWLRLVIEFRGGRRVILKQIIAKLGTTFVFKEKYLSINSRYCLLECTDNDFRITRFIKRRIE